jgi:hypothetical protein
MSRSLSSFRAVSKKHPVVYQKRSVLIHTLPYSLNGLVATF